MQDNNLNGGYPQTPENRGCCNNNGGIFCGCDSEILFFIIIFLLLFTSFGCCNR